MADRPEYKSIWTGQQVDDAVGKIIGNGATPLTTADIVQTEGTSPTKVMSQAAVTSALKNVDPSEKINEAIDEHNSSEQAHPYIQGLISNKPNALNDRSDSQKDTYSANYINNSFAPITFVSNLYASKVSDNTADLVDKAPVLSVSNTLVSTATTNTDYNWSSPDFTFTRDLEVSTTLTAQNSFALNLTFQTSRNATISWGAKIKVSQDNGQSWTYISDNQAYGAIFYETGIGNTAIFNVFTNTIQGTVIYPIGTLLAIEIYKKQTSATALTTTVYCGVEVDNAGIYTYAQFNFTNVNIGTDQLEDGSVTKQKLEQSVQDAINNVANKVDKQSIFAITKNTMSVNNENGEFSIQGNSVPYKSSVRTTFSGEQVKISSAVNDGSLSSNVTISPTSVDVKVNSKDIEQPKESHVKINEKGIYYNDKNISNIPIQSINETELGRQINLATDLEVGKLYLLSGLDPTVIRGTYKNKNVYFYSGKPYFPNYYTYQVLKQLDNQLIFENCNLTPVVGGAGYNLNASYYQYARVTIDTTTGLITNIEPVIMLKGVNGGNLSANCVGIYAPTTSGTQGQILQSNGSDSAPTWIDKVDEVKVDGKTINKNASNELQAIAVIDTTDGEIITSNQLRKAITIRRYL